MKTQVALFFGAIVFWGATSFAGGVTCKMCPAESNACAPRLDCSSVVGSVPDCNNPQSDVLYSFIPNNGTSPFQIRATQKSTGEALKTYGPFQWLNAKYFTDSVNIYDLNSCQIR